MATIKTEILISREEIEQILKEKFLQEPCGNIDGEIEFIIKERSRMCGDIQVTRSYFDGIKIVTTEEK